MSVHHIEAVYDHGVLRPLDPAALPLSDGERVRVTVDTGKPATDPLTLLTTLLDGMSDEQVRQFQEVALDRRWFSERPDSQ